LKSKLDEVLDLLRFDEGRQRAGSEAAERARLLDPASILRDEAEARRFHRYRGEYRSTFHRAHQGLLTVLKRDAAEGCDGTRLEGDGADGRGSDEGDLGATLVGGIGFPKRTQPRDGRSCG